MRKSVKIIILVILLIVFSYSAYRAYDIFIVTKESEDVYEDLNQYVQVVSTTEPTIAEIEEEPEEEKEISRYMEIDFEALKEQNSDFVGWLHLIDSDIISYPVVHYEDNDYYLTHLFDGTPNANGAIFIDYRNYKDFSDDNTVIYGHRMRSGAMFWSLGDFKDQEFYEKHPYFYLELPDKEYRLDVFACYVTPHISEAYTLVFNEEEGFFTDANGNKSMSYKLDSSIPTFEKWYEDVMKKNLLKTNVEVSKEDRLVTFSTCDYSFSKARLVIHCKIVDTNK